MARSAPIVGPLWSARARDWGELQERNHVPLYEAVCDAVVEPGLHVLDVGCGTGTFLGIAAARGATVAGIDAAEGMIEVARERVPEADLRVGDIEELPWDDGVFDVVASFIAVQYAADPAHGLVEMARVTKPGGAVVLTTWGTPEECDAKVYALALAPLLPPPAEGGPGAFMFADEGALESFARTAGLDPGKPVDVDLPFDYPDRETALRGLNSGAPSVRVAAEHSWELVNATVSEAIAPFETPSGGFRFENTFRFLVARKP
jgi:SAM-dependent methyltransferase